MVKTHAIETLLILIALLGVVLFLFLASVVQPGAEMWWILAISTLLLAISDTIMRLRGRN